MFQPIRDETNLRLLNLGPDIRDNILCDLFSSYFLKNERKPSQTPYIFLLMLDASNDNFKATTISSSIKSSKLDEISFLKKKIKVIVIIAFKTS
jgi:hypothetical protein